MPIMAKDLQGDQIAATPDVEAQLLLHTRASMRVCLTAAQLRQLTGFLCEHGEMMQPYGLNIRCCKRWQWPVNGVTWLTNMAGM